MKKILSPLSSITLIWTSTTSLVACNTTQEYTKEQLAKLKEENQINTNKQEIKDNLEWMAPQEKPFNQVDNKWYFAIWKPNNSIYWKISKFKHDTNKGKKLRLEIH
ncbi:lipoprotein [Spiroplasma endosymbiont of Ammophila pubescens]|uniref:lipoprotein n=1 Tax=Spiroplasma endosymbiont of Ammophila pubescens TaxID=3066315 RepID=UPI0032B2BB14